MRPEARALLRRPLFLAGLALVAAGLLAGLFIPGAMLGWLGATVLFSAVPAGSLYLLMMMRLIPGPWGEELRLSAEAATLLTPWASVLFVPVLIGFGAIYPWAAGAKLTAFQALLLNPLFLAVLTIGRFGALYWLGSRMRGRRSTRATSAAGLILLPLLATAAAFVWLLSLDTEFASSAFGLQFIEREVTVALAALLLLRLSIGRPLSRPGVLGGVMLTLLLLWAYLEFLSFFINWSGNLPSGAHWYLLRGSGSWGVLLWVWSGLSGVPLLALLFAVARRNAGWLKAICWAVLLGKACEIAWVTFPGFGLAPLAAFGPAVAGLSLATFAALPAALRQRIRDRALSGVRP
ncbi:conserved hypothetical protein [Altererythrobacter sp. B11]|uniref:hypothetical protein n=1 Tax=Altererythrobacter sp. B11 TaxID=2060312 RepID=UPI000DC7008C|nr:hypothetical protein [Altererythrobacter sp. B11]BBC72774.1 conserved hypothetical protein [Altererythrobacter sp. B11]